MQLFLLILGIVGFAVLIMCFNILRGEEFPDGEISHNKELRKRGIICAKEEELRLWKQTGHCGTGCEVCGNFIQCKEKIETEL